MAGKAQKLDRKPLCGWCQLELGQGFSAGGERRNCSKELHDSSALLDRSMSDLDRHETGERRGRGKRQRKFPETLSVSRTWTPSSCESDDEPSSLRQTCPVSTKHSSDPAFVERSGRKSSLTRQKLSMVGSSTRRQARIKGDRQAFPRREISSTSGQVSSGSSAVSTTRQPPRWMKLLPSSRNGTSEPPAEVEMPCQPMADGPLVLLSSAEIKNQGRSDPLEEAIYPAIIRNDALATSQPSADTDHVHPWRGQAKSQLGGASALPDRALAGRCSHRGQMGKTQRSKQDSMQRPARPRPVSYHTVIQKRHSTHHPGTVCSLESAQTG